MNHKGERHAMPRWSMRTLAGGTALALSLLAAPAMAQGASNWSARSQGARPFNIPAQSLTSAVTAFGDQAGLQVTVDGAILVGLTSQAVNGSLSPAEALGRLLGGTGITYRWVDGRSIALERAPQASNDAIRLGAVQVGGTGGDGGPSSDPGATERTGSYAMKYPSSTAIKMGLTARETPQSVSIVTRQQIEDMALTDLSQVLDRVPGISVGKNDSERFTVYARGFEIENVQFDGVPSTVQSANQYTSFLADSAIYDRIEVVKGATGLLTGAGNPSAVLNLVRKRPTRELQASAEISAGSWNRYRGVVDIATPLTEGGAIRARIVGAAQNADSYVDYYSRDTRNIYGIVEADLGPQTLLTFGADYMQTRADGSSFGHIPLFYTDGTRTDIRRSFNPAARWAYWNNKGTNVFATLKHQWGDDWSLDLAGTHLRQSRDVLYGSAFSGQVDRATGAGIRYIAGTIPTQMEANAANLALTGGFDLLGRRHQIMLNATYSRQTRDAQLFVGAGGVVPNFFEWQGDITEPTFAARGSNRIKVIEKGVAGAIRLRPTDALSIIGGVRLSWYDLDATTYTIATATTEVGDRLSAKGRATPYAGIVYDVLPNWSVYGSYTDIFNPQTYYKLTDGTPIDPLTGRSFEVGVKGVLLDDQLNLSLALFHIRQNNYAQPDGGVTPTGDESYVPVQGVTSKGIEIETSGAITPGWNVYGGYTYRSSKMPPQPDLTLNAVNTNQPKHLVKLSTTYELPGALKRFTVGGTLTWQSSTYFQQAGAPYYRANESAYALVGLMARYAFDNGLSLSANVSNLFDKTYMPGLGSYGTGVYGDPRSFLITARYRF